MADKKRQAQRAQDSPEEQRAAAQATDAQMEEVTRTTAAELSEQPKKMVRLYQTPAGSTDAPLADEVVQINGYAYQIKRGEEIEVPQSVYDVLEQSGRL